MTRGRRLSTTVAAVLGLVLLLPGPAGASVPQDRVVSEDPVNYTPNLLPTLDVPAPAVFALEQRDSTMYAGGKFQALQNARRTASFERANLVAFSATTGTVSRTFLPDVDGPVWAIRASGGSIYVGGTFGFVDGVKRRGVAKLDALTGRLDPTFRAPVVRGDVNDLRIAQGRLIVAGEFTKQLVALDLVTGADTGYLNLGIAGTASDTPTRPHVYRIAVSADEKRLLAVGNFATVSGQVRARAFMVDLGSTSGTLAPWYYPGFQKACRLKVLLPANLRDVDFSPDGSYFVIAATGGASNRGELGETVCDAAARFETGIPNPERPTWINYTGADTLHSVAVTGAAVYVSGHQRWLDNAGGRDRCVPGCVERPGIGAIDPVSGKALPWNPTKSRDVGGRDLLATSTGLWVASDGKLFHGEYRYGIAFAPLPL